MTVMVDASDSAKLVHIRATVDLDKDTKAELDETIDPKGFKVEDGQTVYLIEPDGKSPQSYTITPSGKKKDFFVVSGGITVIRDDDAAKGGTSSLTRHAEPRMAPRRPWRSRKTMAVSSSAVTSSTGAPDPVGTAALRRLHGPTEDRRRARKRGGSR